MTDSIASTVEEVLSEEMGWEKVIFLRVVESGESCILKSSGRFSLIEN